MASNDKVSLDITIGAVVISIGAIIYIGRILYKRKRKRKNLEKVLDPLVELEEIDIKPKKTAADHLGELKEATQKVLQPLRKSSSYSSPKENLSSNFSSGRNSTSSSKTNIYDSILPFTFKLFKVPPPPPPTPLRSDDIRVDPIRISLLNLLLIDESENTLELDLTAPSESSSKKDLSRKMSQPNLNLTNSKKVLPRKISQPELNLSNSKNDLSRKISQSDLNLTNSKNDLSRKISQPDLNLTNSKKDLSRKVSQPDLNSLPRKMSQPDLNPTNSKKDLSRKMSQSDLNLTNSKKDLPRITWSQQIHPPTTHSKKDLLPQLDSSEIRSRNVSSTVPQLDSIIPSESRLKREITRTKPKLDSKVRSRRSHRRKYSRRKETNDYTNFQPIQNIKPIQNAQSEKRIIVETKEVGELTLSSMYSKVKTVLKENQDDEIILDANK